MIENPQIARIFDEIADCLELQDANPFRIRAYRNAARVLRDLPEPATAIAKESPKKLQELPGIGKDLAGKIRAIIETGDLPLHLQLCRKVPAGLRAMMGLPGLGPKRAMLLHRKLGIATLAELRLAAFERRIRDLKGFGEKTEEAILRGLDRLEREGRRVLWAEARPYAEALTARLEETRGVGRVEAAGSYRRRRETVGDLDVLAACADAGAVMDRLASYDGVGRVLARGPTQMSVRLTNGLQVDLRVVPEESFGAALQYFTGSKEHGIELRARALARKLKLNEYGVFRGRRRVAGRAEEEVYGALGLPWIPPELREGRGEVEAAAAGRLPSLVALADVKGDLHMHTTVTDGRDGLEAMAEGAKARGYEYVAITEHSKRVTMARGLDAAGLRKHWAAIDRLAARTPGLALLKGVEVDILDDGSLDLPDEVLREADWVLASLHYGQRQPRAQITRRLLRAIENPVVSAIGHPTGRLLGKRPAYDVDFERVLAAAAGHGCVLELDGQPDRLDLDDVHLIAAKGKGVPIVVDSDAHSVHELGNMEYGIFQARRGGLTPGDVLNTRPLSALRALRRSARAGRA
ncbi:MAG: DNA polymerase/3'-5' exonuclease PolX [Elusimicrobia bacterium]|nr:DNA polymerase/3'-5' exonuclease PolX [Elusimicrobiota bacterium]